MDQQIIDSISQISIGVMLGVALLFAMMFYAAYISGEVKAKFQAGDILISKNVERWEDPVIMRIEEVGNRNYRISYYLPGSHGFSQAKHSSPISVVDTFYRHLNTKVGQS